MKIEQLIIKKLYGHYDYHVSFNKDVTILYGLNGSGKTTVLNILNAIVSGKLFKLYGYQFDSVILKYTEENKIKYVTLIRNEEVYFGYDGNKSKVYWPKVKISNSIQQKRIEERFYERNSFLKEYGQKFNKVYLPVDRAIDKDYDSVIVDPRIYGFVEEQLEPKPIEQVADIIHKKCIEIELEIGKLNNEYRNKTLKAVSMSYNRSGVKPNVFEFIEDKYKTINKIKRIKNSYITFLESLSLLSEEEKQDFSNFVDNLIMDIIQFDAKRIDKDSINNFMQLSSDLDEMYRLETIVQHADELELKKKLYRTPLTLFLDTLNEFLKQGSDEEKEFFIDDDSELCLKSRYDEKVSIEQLSSGERQLVILFTHLIFKLNGDDEAVFVVDEPELSLHMLWQRIYIDRIRKVAPNVQIIFATHSPEIISHYDDKLVELVKIREDVTDGVNV